MKSGPAGVQMPDELTPRPAPGCRGGQHRLPVLAAEKQSEAALDVARLEVLHDGRVLVLPPSEAGNTVVLAAEGYAIDGPLRDLRDEVLLETGPGRAFVAAYYREGPAAARWLRAHPAARGPVRALLAPLVLPSRVLLGRSGAGAALSVLLAGFFLFRRRALRAQPKKMETSGRWFAAAAAILVVGVGAYITIDVGRTLRESSSPSVSVETMGQNQAALSAGVY
jgi:hypothetical protein